MSTQHRVRIASLENQAFALMSRMHVILRRQNNRITDVEYMRIDPAYCRHLLDLAAQSADEDLLRIVEKLEEIYFGKEGLFVLAPPKPPLLKRQDKAPLQAASSSSPPSIDTTPLSSAPVMPDVEPPRAYVGTLR